jgi:hypothetical protein
MQARLHGKGFGSAKSSSFTRWGKIQAGKQGLYARSAPSEIEIVKIKSPSKKRSMRSARSRSAMKAVSTMN